MGKRNPRVAARNHAKHDFCAKLVPKAGYDIEYIEIQGFEAFL